MPMDGVIVLQSGTLHCTLHEVVSHKLQSEVVREGLRVVPNITYAITFAIEASGVSTYPVPATALVKVPIASHNKAV